MDNSLKEESKQPASSYFLVSRTNDESRITKDKNSPLMNLETYLSLWFGFLVKHESNDDLLFTAVKMNINQS